MSLRDDLAQLRADVLRAASARYPEHRLDDLEVLPGGHSGRTHVATLTGPGGELRVVVKSAPPGRPARGRHDVLRQATVLRALGAWGGVPIPEVLFSAEVPTPLFGMSLVEGLAVEPVMEDAAAGERPELVAAAWRDAIDVLAAMQRAAPAALGLGDEPVVAPREELERWRATMRAGSLDTSDPRAPLLAEVLADQAPGAAPACLVHGDFRLGNMLQRDGTIAGVVDWEIWSLGDPRADLGWLTVFADPSNFPGFGRPAPGTPAPAEVVARYLDVTGSDPAGVGWFRALACFKLAAIQAHNLRRHLEGRYHDPHQELLVDSTGALLERGLELAAGA